MRLRVALILCITLAACAAAPPLYEKTSFRQESWAKHSFEEIRARCKNIALHHEHQWNSYEVRPTPYKSCMERYGYLYLGDEGVITHDNKNTPFVTAPVTIPQNSPQEKSAEDTSALYR